jgi:orotidine-5'-phosphate decarboxylase
MERFIDRYRKMYERSGTRLCIGLDTDHRKVPATLASSDNPVLEFNTRIIEATKDLCCAYKLNLAFYESYGIKGIEALRGTIDRIPEGVLAVGDAKRGDIGNTAERYAAAMLDTFDFDAVTVNPYMGTDTLEPYFAYDGVCVFVLALTSNPGSNEFQRQRIGDRALYEHVIDRCMERFGSSDKLGFVVGATHPDELASVRARIGNDVPLLIPGLGTQGGDAERTVQANDGGVALFNVSRAIAAASTADDFADMARKSAERFVEMLRENASATA